MEGYHEFSIRSDTDHDILIAFLADCGFEAFSEGENGILLGYRSSNQRIEAEADLARISAQFPLEYTCVPLPNKNWNEEWEKQFTPIRVGDKLGIRASFHAPLAEVREELIIDPKMAFGTGHHATTWMVSDLMFGVDFSDTAVLDYGCGTGVLALLAGRLGARLIWAVDIERPSYENTLENAATNGIRLDQVIHGTLADVVNTEKFDMILANINRNVILESLASLYDRLSAGGLLFVSGILEQDAERVEHAARAAGFTQRETRQREGWCAWIFQKE